MLGVINLDKPVGPTSHDMVGLLRRLTATRRIGHAGTLDPMASGVLPILVGPATRFSQELSGSAKRYEAVIRLGWRSATDDTEGPLSRGDATPPGVEQAAAELASFVGAIDQRPPDYSARKVGGRAAHRLARAGRPPELAPHRVQIDAIALLDAERGDDWLDLRVDIRCGPGTYIRSIARDLGERLGCGGHLHALRRTEAAGLAVAAASTPAELEALAAEGRLASVLLPVSDLLTLPRLDLTDEETRRFGHGAISQLPGGTADGRYAAYGGGELRGIGDVAAGLLHPDKVLPARTDE